MQCLRIVAHGRHAFDRAAQFAGQRREHLGVGFDDLPLAGIGVGGEVQHFVAGGDDADGDALPDRHVPDAAGEQRAHVPRAQVVVARKQQFRRHDVFSDAPDVLPREGRSLNRDFVAVLHDLFDHDDGVAAFGHGMSGVDGEAGFPGP